MRSAILAAMLLLSSGIALPPVAAQDVAPAAAEPPIVGEARRFMAAYAAELVAGQREAVAARYHSAGATVVAPGTRGFQTRQQIAAVYRSPQWTAIPGFAFDALDYDAVTSDSVVVTGSFHFTAHAGRPPLTLAYAALLMRDGGPLRIRFESEVVPSRPSAPAAP